MRVSRRTIFSYSRRPSSATIFFLLLISGDVEVNPGPTDNRQLAPATGNAQPVTEAAGNSQPVAAAQSPATASSGMLIFIVTISVDFQLHLQVGRFVKLVPSANLLTIVESHDAWNVGICLAVRRVRGVRKLK